MGRYYDIVLTPTAASVSTKPREFTSYPGGTFDPGALNVQLDLIASVSAVPMGNCTVSIEGVAISDLRQAANFSGMQIAVRGGMGTQSLPLANPKQAGLLVQGEIYQSFANWNGTDQNLNFVIVPSLYTFTKPGNFVFIWEPGQSLASALSNALSTAYPNKNVQIDISQNYAARAPFVGGYYPTLTACAQFVKSYTKSQSPNGKGVDIHVLPDGSILVTDGSIAPSPIRLNFTDLIGQPKWVEANTMQFVTVMRGDIQIGAYVEMPKGLPYLPGTTTTTAASYPSQLQYQTTFQGNFVIQSARHIGNFRQADGDAWVSAFQAQAVPV